MLQDTLRHHTMIRNAKTCTPSCCITTFKQKMHLHSKCNFELHLIEGKLFQYWKDLLFKQENDSDTPDVHQS